LKDDFESLHSRYILHKNRNIHLLQLLNHSFTAKVWNVLCHSNQTLLFIETRDEALAQVRYSAYDVMQSKFLFKEITVVDDWWCSLVAVSGDVMLMHLFADGRNPDPKGLLAFHFKFEKVLWSDENARFEASDETQLKVWKDGKRLMLNLMTGKLLENVVTLKENPPLVVNPMAYHSDGQYYSTLATFIKSRKGHQVEGHIEYLDYAEKLILSYHCKSEQGLANYLLIMDKNGEELLNQILGLNFVALGWNTFFIFSNCLVFVRNKMELNIYKLL
jgi:hypothetical protein